MADRIVGLAIEEDKLIEVFGEALRKGKHRTRFSTPLPLRPKGERTGSCLKESKGQPDYAITTAVRRAQQGNSDYIPHLGKPEILALTAHAVAAGKGRKGERDGLLIRLLFDGCLRVSEALGVRPKDMVQDNNGWFVRIMGKGRKPGEAAISSSLAAML